MERVKGWQQALTRFTISRLRTPWKWGGHDCCIFAADGILSITGIDFAEDFRGQYDSHDEAMKFLASLGYRDLGELASSRLPEYFNVEGNPAPMMAKRGDIVLTPGEEGDYLSICDGMTSVGPTIPRGIRHAPMTIAKRAWRVG